MRVQGYAASTIWRYGCCIDDFSKYLLKRRLQDLRAVQREDIEAYQAELRDRKLSNSTRVQNFQAVCRLFGNLVDQGLLLLDPTARVPRLRRKHELPRRVPTQSQVQRLLDAADTSRRAGVRDRAILEVLYGSAIRVGELVQLCVHDTDLENRQLRIERGKGNKGRVVPLTESCRQWLDEYITDVRPWWLRKKPRQRELFLTQNARPMRPAVVRDAIHRLCKKLKLASISPHGLRHAAATHMVAAGADIRYVQKLLGHESLATTQRYTRVTPQEVKATHAACHPRERGE